MGDFWAESIHLASPATERFYAFWDRANLDCLQFSWRTNFKLYEVDYFQKAAYQKIVIKNCNTTVESITKLIAVACTFLLILLGL